jgi:hypothetical protein
MRGHIAAQKMATFQVLSSGIEVDLVVLMVVVKLVVMHLLIFVDDVE